MIKLTQGNIGLAEERQNGGRQEGSEIFNYIKYLVPNRQVPFCISRESIIRQVVLGTSVSHPEIIKFLPHTVQMTSGWIKELSQMSKMKALETSGK